MVAAKYSDRLQDEIEFSTPVDPDTQSGTKHVLVFWVCGNPGLVEYYRNYLASLTDLLHQQNVRDNNAVQYHVHGGSLAGFDITPYSRRIPGPRDGDPPPFSLDEVKWDLAGRVERKARQVIQLYKVEEESIPVILIGHSVGAWLLLETVAWFQNAHRQPKQRSTSPNGDGGHYPLLRHARVAGGILLFPTVIELAKSPRGINAGWILKWQSAAYAISLLAKYLFAFVPLAILASFLQLLLRMPQHPARVTAAFLKSPHGVKQALYMARDELRQLSTDDWTDELWGVQEESAKSLADSAVSATGGQSRHVPLFFFWGENDHWIARSTRDSLIAKRARTAADGHAARPVMEVDTHKLPHAFSIKDAGADIVARRTSQWIGETVRDLL